MKPPKLGCYFLNRAKKGGLVANNHEIKYQWKENLRLISRHENSKQWKSTGICVRLRADWTIPEREISLAPKRFALLGYSGRRSIHPPMVAARLFIKSTQIHIVATRASF